MKPAISIIMPVYGVEAYIARAIESVRRQTFTDWELLIVNDGTKDRSREIAAEYEKQDARIHIIDKPNGGLTSARLKGLEFAIGNYLSFIDSDDTLQPEYLEVLYSNIQKYDADVCMCSYNTVYGDKPTPQHLYFTEETTILENDNIFVKYFLPQIPSAKAYAVSLPSFMWLRMFRKEVVKECMFVSERGVYKEDLAFSARISKELNRVVAINTPLYNYYVNDGSLTQKYRDNAWRMMLSLNKEIEQSLSTCPQFISDDRIKGQMVSSVHYALMNAARLDYRGFKCEYNIIRNNPDVKSILGNLSCCGLAKAYLALLISLKMNCPYLLYKYNRTRI